MTKKALLVGINAYPGSPLNGCLNDVEDWFHVLTTVGGFNPDKIQAICDQRATTQGIKAGLDWLRNGAQTGDEIVFTYSGHGSQVRDKNGDELDDGMDECICPVNLNDPDYWDNGVILDDDIGNWLKSFPAGVKLTVILDSCHSGSGTRELGPGNPHPVRERYLPPPLDIELRHRAVGEQRKALHKRRFGHGGVSSSKAVFGKKISKTSRGLTPIPGTARGTVVIPGMNHLLMSGCRSDQTSADAYINGRYNGAFSYYAINEVKRGAARSLNVVHAAYLNDIKSGGYTQEPQLEGPLERVNAPLFG